MLAISAAAWALLLLRPGGIAHCSVAVSARRRSDRSLMLLSVRSPASLAAGWTLMLMAMMAPALIAPILHVRLQAFAPGGDARSPCSSPVMSGLAARGRCEQRRARRDLLHGAARVDDDGGRRRSDLAVLAGQAVA